MCSYSEAIIPRRDSKFAQKMFDDCPERNVVLFPRGLSEPVVQGGSYSYVMSGGGAQSPLEKTMSTLRGVAFTGCK